MERHLADLLRRPRQGRAPGRVDAGGVRALDRGTDLLSEREQRRAALRHRLAAEQIERLDAARSLVDGVELLIAQPRFGEVLAGVAVAAMDLHRERVRF